MANEAAAFKFFEGNVVNEIRRLEAKINEQAGRGQTPSGEGRDRHGKPITEYKSINELGKLANDKTGFRDWKYRMKNALKQVCRDEGILKIMEWLEKPTTRLTGTETLDELMQQAEDDEDVQQNEPLYKKLSEDLQAMLLFLSEDKSQAFLMVKRADNGLIAWNRVNKWYTATSGIALSDRIAAIMRPSQAKRDEDVMYQVEKWLDDVRRCRAMGATDLA